jgi:hypothetical protein
MFGKDQEITLEDNPVGSGGGGTDPATLQKAAKHREKAARLRARAARLKTKIEKLKHLVTVLEERAQRYDSAAQEVGGGHRR